MDEAQLWDSSERNLGKRILESSDDSTIHMSKRRTTGRTLSNIALWNSKDCLVLQKTNSPKQRFQFTIADSNVSFSVLSSIALFMGNFM